jgi:RluA family pseudouridine synthase
MKGFALLYEDDDIVVIDKAPGLLSVPGRYDALGLSAFSLLRETRPGLLAPHRLDKETSGVLLFAKNLAAFRSLSEQFSRHSLRKTYCALLEGRPSWQTILCDAPLRPDGDRRHRTIAAPDGKESLTELTLRANFGLYSFVEARPRTGRTHQIRAHCAYLGHPVACDPLYGGGGPLLLSAIKHGYRPPAEEERPLLARPALHAERLEFEHPQDGRPVGIEAPLPKDMRAALGQLGRRN